MLTSSDHRYLVLYLTQLIRSNTMNIYRLQEDVDINAKVIERLCHVMQVYTNGLYAYLQRSGQY
jgi:hypothetical protein